MRDLIWEVQGGYEEVNKLAGKPAHIKAVRNELQKSSLHIKCDTNRARIQTRSLSHQCTTRTKRNKCMILKAKIVRKVVHLHHFTWEMKFLPLPVQPCILKTRGLLGDGFLEKYFWLIISLNFALNLAWPLTARTTKSWAMCWPTRCSESKFCSLKNITLHGIDLLSTFTGTNNDGDKWRS